MTERTDASLREEEAPGPLGSGQQGERKQELWRGQGGGGRLSGVGSRAGGPSGGKGRLDPPPHALVLNRTGPSSPRPGLGQTGGSLPPPGRPPRILELPTPRTCPVAARSPWGGPCWTGLGGAGREEVAILEED